MRNVNHLLSRCGVRWGPRRAPTRAWLPTPTAPPSIVWLARSPTPQILPGTSTARLARQWTRATVVRCGKARGQSGGQGGSQWSSTRSLKTLDFFCRFSPPPPFFCSRQQNDAGFLKGLLEKQRVKEESEKGKCHCVNISVLLFVDDCLISLWRSCWSVCFPRGRLVFIYCALNLGVGVVWNLPSFLCVCVFLALCPVYNFNFLLRRTTTVTSQEMLDSTVTSQEVLNWLWFRLQG